jgi:2-iminobutanoate/2-iminopropanoate deaminase
MTHKFYNDAPNAPDAVGPYSQASEAHGLVFISGQIPRDPKTGKLVEGPIELHVRQVMSNLLAVLKHAGLDFSHVLKTTILLAHMSDFAAVNAEYEKILGGVRPARATFAVKELPLGAQIEIEMIAGR